MKAGKIVAWVLGIGLVLWVLIAAIAFAHDAPARHYAQTATTTAAVQQPSNDWSLFWWGYMWGGGFGHNGYNTYRTTTNTYYQTSPQYQAQQAESGTWGSGSTDSGAWSSNNDSGTWGSSNDNEDSHSGTWGSAWSSSNDSGSWGGGSSWSSSESSGSWGGSSESSGGSGSWGD